MEPSINILIANDYLLEAKLLSRELNSEPQFNVIDIMDNREEILEVLISFRIDIFLLDIQMLKTDGLAFLQEIRHEYPDLKIILLTDETNGTVIKKVIEMGANGYITKYSDTDDVKKAIFTVLSGETFLCKLSYHNFMDVIKNSKGKINSNNKSIGKGRIELSSYRLNKSNKNINPGCDNFSLENLYFLTLREKEVFRHIVEGKTSKAYQPSYLSVTGQSKHTGKICLGNWG